MNRFYGIGNLCRDIELKTTNSGKSYLQNSIAIKNDYKNANGEYDSEFINIVVWGKTAEFLVKYAQKGMKIAIEGRLTNRSYDKADGTKGNIAEIVCSSVELLTSKKVTNSSNQEENNLYEEFGNQLKIDDNFLD